MKWTVPSAATPAPTKSLPTALTSDTRPAPSPNTGVAWQSGTLGDAGRGAVTGVEKEFGAFKSPTLREVARTAPYMHDGSIATLAEVLDFYDRGGVRNPAIDPKLRSLGLTVEEKHDIIAFLQSLSGEINAGR